MSDVLSVCSLVPFDGEVLYRLHVAKDVSCEQLRSMIHGVSRRFNAGSKVASRRVPSGDECTVGLVLTCEVSSESSIYMGLRGEYPSANVVLLVDGAGIDSSIERVSAGSELVFQHCVWKHVEKVRDLPVRDQFYRSIRRTLLAMLETELSHF